MKHFAIIGHPIGHSLSPLMHNTGFAELGIDAHYDAIDVAPENLSDLLKRFRNEGITGFNVTVPHKQTVMPFLDEISDEAKAIGAVNTVHQKNGRLYGYNTDVFGVQKSLEPYRKKINGNTCLVFGAGGGARSVLFVLTHHCKPKKIYIASRTVEKSESLANDFQTPETKIKILPTDAAQLKAAIDECVLIVNSTPLGMFPNVNVSPLPGNIIFHQRHIVFDLIYRPLQTLLLHQASEANATTIDGLEMLIQQGAAAFKIWTGQDFPCPAVQSILLKKLAD
jgi:shikimate dehydrogenase